MWPENPATAREKTPRDRVDMLAIARRTWERETPEPSPLTRFPCHLPLRAGVGYSGRESHPMLQGGSLMSRHGHSTNVPSPQQVQATNDAITELSGLSRTVMGAQIKQPAEPPEGRRTAGEGVGGEIQEPR